MVSVSQNWHHGINLTVMTHDRPHASKVMESSSLNCSSSSSVRATQLEIDGSSINDIATFYEEINRVFMAGESWMIGHSLDAFNDLLYGGYGALQGVESVELRWRNIAHSRTALGCQTTREYYLDKLKPGSPYNKKLFEKKLEALDKGTGETYFDCVMAIIADHPTIRVISQ